MRPGSKCLHILMAISLMGIFVFCQPVQAYTVPQIWPGNVPRPIPPSLEHTPEPPPDVRGKTVLSIEEAIDIGFRSNPDLRKTELQLDKAEILRDEAAQAVTYVATGELLVTPQAKVVINNYEQATINYEGAKKALTSERLRLEKDIVTAYATAIKQYNQIEVCRLLLAEMENQNKVYMVATVAGVMANTDLRSSKRALEQTKERLVAAEAGYNLAMSTLRNLLNQSHDWNPVLTSRPELGSVSRNSLDIELGRATDQSIMMLQAETLLDLEESKQYWGLGYDNNDPYMDKLNLYLRELDYEQARRNTRDTVEQLYHRIDVLQQEIVINEQGLKQKKEELETLELKYEVGLIPLRSLQPGIPSLAAARLEISSMYKTVENLRADLVVARAAFGYLTGQQVYSKLDWTTGYEE